ncbi:hypothetical protein D3C72_1431870 [compost metagenome]
MPPALRVAPISICWKRLKSLGMSSGAMPTPVSTTSVKSSPSRTRARTSTRPPASVNLIALATRLVIIWVTRGPSTTTGSGTEIDTVSDTGFWSASGRISVTASATSWA